MQQTTNKTKTTGNKLQEIKSKRIKTWDRQQQAAKQNSWQQTRTATRNKHTINSKEQTTNDKQQTTHNKHHAAKYPQQTAAHK